MKIPDTRNYTALTECASASVSLLSVSVSLSSIIVCRVERLGNSAVVSPILLHSDVMSRFRRMLVLVKLRVDQNSLVLYFFIRSSFPFSLLQSLVLASRGNFLGCS